MFATIITAIWSTLRASIQHGGIVRMEQQGPYLRGEWQAFGHTLPLSSAFRVAVQATLSHILAFARQTNVDVCLVIVCSHHAPPRQQDRRNSMEHHAYFGIFPSVSQSKSLDERVGTCYGAATVRVEV